MTTATTNIPAELLLAIDDLETCAIRNAEGKKDSYQELVRAREEVYRLLRKWQDAQVAVSLSLVEAKLEEARFEPQQTLRVCSEKTGLHKRLTRFLDVIDSCLETVRVAKGGAQ